MRNATRARFVSLLSALGPVLAIIRYWDDQRNVAYFAIAALIALVFVLHPLVAFARQSIGFLLFPYALFENWWLAAAVGAVSVAAQGVWASRAVREQRTADLNAQSKIEEGQLKRLASLEARVLPQSTIRLGGAEWSHAYFRRTEYESTEEINRKCGEFWFELSMFEKLNERVPHDIASGMPPGVNEKVVREHYWTSAVEDSLRELDGLIALWEPLHAFQVPSDQEALSNLHFWTDAIGQDYIEYLLHDLRCTRARWHDDEATADDHCIAVEVFEDSRTEALAPVRDAIVAYLELEHEQPLMGITQEMAKFLRFDDGYLEYEDQLLLERHGNGGEDRD